MCDDNGTRHDEITLELFVEGILTTIARCTNIDIMRMGKGFCKSHAAKYKCPHDYHKDFVQC